MKRWVRVRGRGKVGWGVVGLVVGDGVRVRVRIFRVASVVRLGVKGHVSRVSVEKSKNMGKGSKVKSQGSACQGSKVQDLASRI